MKILVNEKISQHKYKTPEGYLICVDSVLARTGNQTYRKNELFADSEDDSEIEVGRSPEEVFSAETLASFENKPITIEHPDEDVNIENYKDYAVGFVRDVKQGKFEDQNVILGTLVITDKDAIEGIENGEHVELSCGYDCDIEDGTDGYQQKHIRGNHVALCEAGRAGIAKIIDSVGDEDTVKYKGYTLKFHKGYNMWLNMKDYYEVFDERGNKVAMKKDLKSAKEYVDNGGFKDSVEDAKKYAVEFTYNGDSVSNYLGQVWVYANSDKEALKKAEQWAKNKYDDAWNFKIVPKAYSNSEVIDSIEDANHLPPKLKNEIKKYLGRISTFVPKSKKDWEAKDFIDDMARYFRIDGTPLKFTRESIKGWNRTGDGTLRKDYIFSVDGYDDRFLFSIYANDDYETTEVNAYFTDSVKDASQFTTRDLDKLYQARIRFGAVTSKSESISKKVGKLTVGITLEIKYKENNNVAVPDELIFTVWDSSRWNNGNDDKTFTYRSYKEMTSKYREVIDYANSRLSSLTSDSIVKDMDRAIFYKRRDGGEYILSIDPQKIRENGQGTIYVIEQDGLDFPNPSDGNKLLQANTMGSSDALQNYLRKKGKNCKCIDETPDEEQTTMLEKDLEHFEDADVNDTALNWKKTYLGEETDEIRLPHSYGSIIASYDDIRNKTRIRFLGGSRGSSRDDVYVKGKPKTLEQLLKYIKDSVNTKDSFVKMKNTFSAKTAYAVAKKYNLNVTHKAPIGLTIFTGDRKNIEKMLQDLDWVDKRYLHEIYDSVDTMVKDINPDYANCLRELDKDVNQLYKLYQHGDKAPSTILRNMGYKEVGDDRFMMKSGLNKMIIEFDDFSDYIEYYVVDESGKIPKGYTVTKFKFYDSKAKDSIYSLTVQGQKSKKLVRAKDAREAIDKYTKMFPKDKVKSVKKTDKFNNIIEIIKR